MSKYIDAEKLKRLVSELKERAKRNCCDSWGIVPDALEEVEGFITSLQQDQPEVDLEEEIERIIENEERFMKFQVKSQLIKYVARHFAEWGAIHLNARKEEQIWNSAQQSSASGRSGS